MVHLIIIIRTTDLWWYVDIMHCEKNLAYPPTASGSYGRLKDEIRIDFTKILNFLHIKLLDFLLTLIPVQCYYGIINAFQSTFFK